MKNFLKSDNKIKITNLRRDLAIQSLNSLLSFSISGFPIRDLLRDLSLGETFKQRAASRDILSTAGVVRGSFRRPDFRESQLNPTHSTGKPCVLFRESLVLHAIGEVKLRQVTAWIGERVIRTRKGRQVRYLAVLDGTAFTECGIRNPFV